MNFEIIMHITNLIVSTYVCKILTEKFIVDKTLQPRIVSKILKKPNRISIYNDINISKIELKYKKYVTNFIKEIIKNFDSADLTNFYNNVNKLDIKYNLKLKDNIGGRYLSLKDKIEIKDEYDKYIYHELFHMASSYFINNIDYSGFEQIKRPFVIGKGINEGYTELLTNRYFPKEFSSSNSYYYAMKTMQEIENLVDKNKMQSLYLNANLLGLIDELKKYNSEEQIMKFITNMDFLINYLDYLRKKNTFIYKNAILKTLKEINIFLFDCYAEKLLTKSTFSYSETMNKIYDYIEKIPNAIEFTNYGFPEEYEYMTEDDIRNYILNIKKHVYQYYLNKNSKQENHKER
ncbi:MAG: hypothetical protein IJ068_02230 [Bacilli bacterium]|nr:hypothetical protein [Bacilli bacterium]